MRGQGGENFLKGEIYLKKISNINDEK